METNTSIREKLILKNWKEAQRILSEDWAQRSYWYSNDPVKLTIHLLLVEDLTNAQRAPKLFIWVSMEGYRQLTVDDID